MAQGIPPHQAADRGQRACDGQRVSANGRTVKASYDVKVGGRAGFRFGEQVTRVEVLSVGEHVGKGEAAAMYRSCEDMTNWLVKTFIRDAGNGEDPAVRQRYGLLSGIVGILLNLCLSAGNSWPASSPGASPSRQTPSTTSPTRAPRW